MKKKFLLSTGLCLTLFLAACGDEKAPENTIQDGKTEAQEIEVEAATLGLSNQLAVDLPEITENTLNLRLRSREYIDQQEKLFAGVGIKEKVDSTITPQQLTDNVEDYFETVVSFKGDVVSFKGDVVSFKGDVVSFHEKEEGALPYRFIHLYAEDGQSYLYITYEPLGNIALDDSLQVVGIPLGIHEFANVGGGVTKAIVLFGGTIEKQTPNEG